MPTLEIIHYSTTIAKHIVMRPLMSIERKGRRRVKENHQSQKSPSESFTEGRLTFRRLDQLNGLAGSLDQDNEEKDQRWRRLTVDARRDSTNSGESQSTKIGSNAPFSSALSSIGRSRLSCASPDAGATVSLFIGYCRARVGAEQTVEAVEVRVIRRSGVSVDTVLIVRTCGRMRCSNRGDRVFENAGER